MSTDFLISVLNDIDNAARINREKASNIVLEQPKLIKNLVELTFDVDNKTSVKAAWVLEWICTHQTIDYILPYINKFTSNIGNLYLDSAVRPCAKICEHLAKAYTDNKENNTKNTLTKEHIDLIIATGFDWLITNQKIAVKAYTMTSLYLFGKEIAWVHRELEHIIRTKVIHESKGCAARGKHILALMKKEKK